MKIFLSDIVLWVIDIREVSIMFHGTIKGLDMIFETDITPPMVILVTGPPGSMKSTFIQALMSRYLDKSGEFGLYATLEETVASNLRNMESVGIDLSLNLQITDFTELRRSGEEALDYLQFTKDMILHFKKKIGKRFTTFALDSLGALYSLMPVPEREMRKKMFHFFTFLRDQGLVSFITLEQDLSGQIHSLGSEGFLGDGIIFLGLKRAKGRLKRFIQVEKMRGVRHSMEMFALDVRPGEGLIILGPLLEE